jgi:hypothetical protein
MLDILKEAGSFLGVMPELVAKDAEGPGGVGKATGHLRGRIAVDKEGPQGFILPVEGFFGG